MIDVDVLVVGSGFSGSILSMALARRGRRVAMVERGRHPRFAIGESSTPLANVLLEEIADGYELPRLRHFSRWGTWQRARPEVACGVKRGFSFFFHCHGEPFHDTAAHERQLLVAASPRNEVADTHWYRPDLDAALVQDAQDAGVLYFDRTSLDAPVWHGDSTRVDGQRDGARLSFRAGFVVDASGPRGFLSQALGLPERPLRWLPHTEGLYAHFEHVGLWDQVVSLDGTPPYPVDDAALHHVFPGGWIWVLRFGNGITSAGAALTRPLAEQVRAGDGRTAWRRLLDRIPSVAAQFAEARETMPFVHAAPLARRSTRAAGHGWAMIPSAAGVIDPLLSTGFPLTLLGVVRLLHLFDTTQPGQARELALRDYEARTLAELDATEHLVAALYASMDDPSLFKRLSLLYFAAASFSEAARRLRRPTLAPGFLLHAHPTFGPGLRACADAVLTRPRGSTRLAVMEDIARLAEPFDTAGLLDAARGSWFPVLASDLLDNRAKLDASAEEVLEMLVRAGVTPAEAVAPAPPSTARSQGLPARP